MIGPAIGIKTTECEKRESRNRPCARVGHDDRISREDFCALRTDKFTTRAVLQEAVKILVR